MLVSAIDSAIKFSGRVEADVGQQMYKSVVHNFCHIHASKQNVPCRSFKTAVLQVIKLNFLPNWQIG